MLPLNATRRNAKKVKNANVKVSGCCCQFSFVMHIFAIYAAVCSRSGWMDGMGVTLQISPLGVWLSVCLCVIHATTTIDHIRTSQSRPVFSVFCENCGLRQLAKKAQKAKKRQNHEILRKPVGKKKCAKS